jgi:UDP-glucose 4-epimerase
MNVFITGARGAIGKAAADAFSKLGWTVTRFSRNADSCHLALDTLEAEIVRTTPDTILHLAWSTYPATAEILPGTEWSADLPNLVELCRTITKVPLATRPQLLFLSSGAVYGESGGQPLDEPCEPHPKGWYARGKLAGERLISDFGTTLRLPYTIVRASSVYGFFQASSRAQGIIPKLVEACQSGAPCPLWGDGSARKDYLHVQDLVALLRLLIEGRVEGTFNACTGRSVTLRIVIDLVEKTIGQKLQFVTHPELTWDVQNTVLCSEKVHHEVGWSHSFTLEDGITDLIARLRWKKLGNP